jgi:4-amino-4-deoxy-L-arabinose transferase-like glycosyltransferase
MPSTRGGLVFFYGSGLCFGLAFLMKQPGILFAVFAGLYRAMAGMEAAVSLAQRR